MWTQRSSKLESLLTCLFSYLIHQLLSSRVSPSSSFYRFPHLLHFSSSLSHFVCFNSSCNHFCLDTSFTIIDRVVSRDQREDLKKTVCRMPSFRLKERSLVRSSALPFLSIFHPFPLSSRTTTTMQRTLFNTLSSQVRRTTNVTQSTRIFSRLVRLAFSSALAFIAVVAKRI